MLLIVLSTLLFSFSGYQGTTTPTPACSTDTCPSNQYCAEHQGSYRCYFCDPACDGCTGPGNTACKQCKPGFELRGSACEDTYRMVWRGGCPATTPVEGQRDRDCISRTTTRERPGRCNGSAVWCSYACPPKTYGTNCTGTCHCLLDPDDPDDCNQATGACRSFLCDRGWTDLPTCQTPCDNTYGSDCKFTCHCPPNDNCSAINGLCSGGKCEEGWSGSGCQNQLPALSDPPVLFNVTCAELVLQWRGWRKNFDVGNSVAVILRYEVFYLVTNATEWQPISVSQGLIPHVDDQETYTLTLSGLIPDATYKFRVDVRQKDGEKPMDGIVYGKESQAVNIPCTVPETTTTTTPLPGTTSRPPGNHLLDSAKFTVSFLDDTTVNVGWAVLDNVTDYTLNLTLFYYAKSIGDCEEINPPEIFNITIPAAGSFNISQLLPWRQYTVNVTATSIEHDIEDFIMKVFSTTEQEPSGAIQNIQVTARTKNGGTATWDNLPCADRGGDLLYYFLEVYALPATTLQYAHGTNVTSHFISSLLPYRLYGINVTFVNSKGSSESTNLTEFRTLEDVPGPPSISTITTERTSLTVTIVPPAITNGILINYVVTIDTRRDFSTAISRTQSVTHGNTVTIPLLAFSLYYVKVRAETSAGPGPYSPVYNATTKEDVPNPPENLNFEPDIRNESCIGLTWSTPSVVTGTITGYNVSYSETGTSAEQKLTTNVASTSTTICDLNSGRFYDIEVYSRGSAGYSAPAPYQASTEQSDPPVPPKPVVLNTTATSIGIALDPVVLSTPALRYNYIVFVSDVTSQRQKRDTCMDGAEMSRIKRAVGTGNFSCPSEDDVQGYIARNFSQSDIPTRTEFIVGDGKSYGDYNNTILVEDHLYVISYVLTSYFEGICKYSFSTPDNPVKAAAIIGISSEPTTVPEDNTALIIVIVVLVLIILVVIIIVILVCWLRRRSRAQKYVPQINDEKYDLKVYKVDDYDPQKYWNTVYSLRESRYIIAGRKYLPEDQQFMNGSVGVGNTGPPITFSDEFHSLPHEKGSPSDFAKRPENTLKNRFSHLLPYDHSRVILEPDTNSSSNYINANFVAGYKNQNAYIAAQSPFDEETVLDFWRMIYQYEIRVIVMMANIVEDNIVKCTQYWPSSGRAMYGSFVLDLVNVQQYAGYYIRTIKVRTKDDPHWQIVYIFDLTYWPDHGVPEDTIPLLEMRHKVSTFHNKDKSPVVVHCGTGVSRTGVFIAIDSLLEQYQADGRISVYSFVRKMRKDRPAMVRTVKQYIFIYEAIFEAMVAGNTLASYDLKEMYQKLTRKNPNTQHSFLRDQFKCLQEYTRKLYPHMCSNALLPANVGKNRFSEVVPPDIHRPSLYTPGGVGRTDYINAVFADSHFKPDHFIITQTPLHTTVIDFWKLVYDHQVETIVMMENFKNEDDTCAEYWPEDHMKQYEPFFVETTDVFQQENITIRHLKLVSMHRPHESRVVRQFQFNAWTDAEFIPKSKSMLLDVMDLVKDWQAVSNNDTAPIIVHCKDGATHSGLFTAVYVLCEKMLDENEVDLFHTVKHIKIRRNQAIDTLDQYRFCYKALWDFINMRMPGGTLTEKMSQTKSDRPYVSLSMTSYGSGQELIT